ncbi:MAG: hypothetical protein DSO07_13135 [Thermoproteota archaeon]|jgi:hypothetical protein|uniref:Uncharacterized protein n=1 Tax=Candidatus Methanodesulfokora washburnensis TaxID=2478471 RepID=A0A429GEI6_9CREN|nr:hypothetical protein [Candidatus Methanodesulfokores washburnensis]RSN72258.1 hypothetical protein D6D85_14580 [Candidatus Methanodesulfokores washburnensis]TDA36879.1 MAG: hypothetical protein DSO07_13135 [Candidatus Korarchaeota archaeon]
MRTGSGGVLLIGFAALVLILSLAAYVNPATIQVKVDPSQDFVDVTDSVNQLVKTVKFLPVGDSGKTEWLESQLETLRKETGFKGVIFNTASYVVNNKVLVLYQLQKGETFFNGTAGDILYFSSGGSGGGGGGGGGESATGPLVFVPSELCLLKTGPISVWPKFFLVLNPTTQKYDATMEITGSDAVFPWIIISYDKPVEVSTGHKPYLDNSSVDFDMPAAKNVTFFTHKFRIPGTASTNMLIWRFPGSSGDEVTVYLPSINAYNSIDARWYNLIDYIGCMIRSIIQGVENAIPTFGGG